MTAKFSTATSIDVAAAAHPETLRQIAVQLASIKAHGPEILMVNTNGHGAAMALNALINVWKLGYTDHTLIVGYDSHTCAKLGASAARLPQVDGRDALTALACTHDSWWEAHLWSLASRKRFLRVQGRQAQWMIRWSVFARLLRLGYNVLSADVDGVFLDDIYAHLHSAALCGRFTLMYASDYNRGSTWLQTGFVYSCGASRDGAASWVVAEVVDRYLRFVDACEEAGGGGAGAQGTACPRGSWLRAARLFDGFSFDMYSHRGVVHSSAARNGSMWWSQLEDTSSTAWPWNRNRSTCLRVEWEGRSRGIRIAGSVDGHDALPSPQQSRGEPLAARAERLSSGTGERAHWIYSDLTGQGGDGDPSRRWAERFGLGRAGSEYRKAYWAALRPAVPIATQLPRESGLALDLEVETACSRPPTAYAGLERSHHRAVCGGAPVGAGPHSPFRVPRHLAGLLPHRRGPLSRAWQRALDSDLLAGAGERRLGAPVALDGEGGARWAAAPRGDEAVVLLPPWLVSHWTVAHRGLLGSLLPRTVFFHATNAADKELALKANGYWHYSVNVAREASGSVEGAIWGGGARPRVVAFPPWFEAEPELPACDGCETGCPPECAASPLRTADLDSYLAEVVTPLLLASAISGRVAGLPSLPCASIRSWRSARGEQGAWRRRADQPAPLPYTFDSCRLGACAFDVASSGAASAAERAQDERLVASFRYASPFGGGRADAHPVANGSARCVPFECDPLDTGFASGGQPRPGTTARLLHAPEWARYRAELKGASPAEAPTVRLGNATTIAHAGAPAASVRYDVFASALLAASSHVVYLPSRLRITDVPPAMQRRCGCKTDWPVHHLQRPKPRRPKRKPPRLKGSGVRKALRVPKWIREGFKTAAL